MGTEGHSLKACCRLLDVASSGFFVWRTKPPSARSIRHAWLGDVITEIWERSRRTYGWRHVQAELDDMYNQHVNHKLVRAVMRELGIGGPPETPKRSPERQAPRNKRLLVGQSMPDQQPRWSTLLSRWLSTLEDLRWGWWSTQIMGRNTRRGRSVVISVPLDWFSPWEPSETRMTTRWLSRFGAGCRLSC
jgi:hypothetical protein